MTGFPYEKLPKLSDARLAKLAAVRLAHLRGWSYFSGDMWWEDLLSRDLASQPSIGAMREQLLAILAEQQRRLLAPLIHERSRLVLALHRAHGQRMIEAVDKFVQNDERLSRVRVARVSFQELVEKVNKIHGVQP